MRWMKRLSLILALMLLLPAVPETGARADEVSFVRVRLSTNDVKKLTITVKGTYTLTEAGRTFTNGTLTLTGDGSNVTVEHSDEGELYTGRTVSIERNELGRDAGYLRFVTKYGTRLYLGSFSVTSSGSVLTIVNRVPMTHYLYGVVGHEMSDTFPLEALKAQAVTAKCYAMLKMQSADGKYDIIDTSADQVYKGYTASYQNVIAAVDAVADLALTYNGQVMICYYAASNGGYMLRPSSNWTGPSPYDGAYSEGVDEYDMKNPSSPRELIEIPENFFPSTAPAALYNLLYPKLYAAATKRGAMPSGYTFTSLLRIDNVTSMHDDGTTNGVNHVKAVVDATVIATTDHIPETPTPAPTGTPSPTPEGTPVVSFVPEGTASPSASPAASPAPSAPPSAAPAGTAAPEGTPSTSGTWTAASSGSADWSSGAYTYGGGDFPDWVHNSHVRRDAYDASKLTIEVPVSFTFKFSELEGLGLYSNDSLRVMYAIKTDTGFALQRCRYGHGVGMSQRGAQQMADEGKTFRDILAYYYGGATLSDAPVTVPEQLPSVTPAPNRMAGYANGGTGEVINEEVNLRSAPSTNARVKKKLSVGTALQLTGLSGDFYAVTVTGTNDTGYCHADYVRSNADGIIARGEVSGAAVNFRKGPDTSFDSLGKLSRNTELAIFGVENGWYRAVALSTGETGYVVETYVNITEASTLGTVETPEPTATPEIVQFIPSTPTPTPRATPTPTPIPTPEGAYRAEGTLNASGVNLREGASTSNKSLGKLNSGDAVSVYGKIGSWYSVNVTKSGQTGYIYAKYVTLKRNEATASEGEINGYSVSLRRGPGTNHARIQLLKRNQKVSVLGSSGSWYEVRLTGSDVTGFVFAKYVTVSDASLSGTDRQGIVTTLLNLRTEPSVGESSRILATMSRGDVVTVHAVENGFCFLTYKGITGYCIASCVEVS